MTKSGSIKVFDEQSIRSLWDDEQEEWCFSVIDVVAVLTDSDNPAAYWRKLKQRLKQEGNESVTNCHALKMRAKDGKMRKTDCATTEQLFRLIQSIPSPKTEPFKLWMAQVASERIDQLQDPELSICLVPYSSGLSYNDLKGVDLWEVYYTLTPRPRQESEKKYKRLTRH